MYITYTFQYEYDVPPTVCSWSDLVAPVCLPTEESSVSPSESQIIGKGWSVEDWSIESSLTRRTESRTYDSLLHMRGQSGNNSKTCCLYIEIKYMFNFVNQRCYLRSSMFIFLM